MPVPLAPYPTPPAPVIPPSGAGTQSQLVCSGCRNLLLYPQGASSVCCAVCNVVTSVPPPGTEMAQLVCGGCHTLLMYIRGATSVQCSCCHTVNLALEDIIYPYFYKAIRSAYPILKIISNCDGSRTPLNHPADFYDFHTYKEPPEMFSDNKYLDIAPRNGPKAFVSEYAAFGTLASNGNFEDALSEAAFLIGLERNSNLYTNRPKGIHYIPHCVIDNRGLA